MVEQSHRHIQLVYLWFSTTRTCSYTMFAKRALIFLYLH